MRVSRRGVCVLRTAAAVGLILAVAAPALAQESQARTLQGKSYVVVMVLKDPTTGEPDSAIGCLTFRKRQMCTEQGDCGPYTVTEQTGSMTKFDGELTLESDAGPVTTQVLGFVEFRGSQSSLAGTLFAPALDLNAAVAGVRLARKVCIQVGLSDDG